MSMAQAALHRPVSKRRDTGIAFLVFLAVAVGGFSSARAATYYWDTTGTTAGFGTASGTWNTSNYWSTSSAGTATTAGTSITTSDSVFFGTDSLGLASGTVTITATGQSFGSMTFGSASGAITLTSGSLTLATSATVTMNATVGTIGSVLTGASSGLVKEGTGTLTLVATNNYAGSTTINAGVLQIGSGTTTGAIASTGAISIASGAGLVSNRSNTMTLSNNITGSGTITNGGTGELSLSGSNTFNGTIVANAKMNITGTYAAIGVPNVVTNSTFSLGLPFVDGTCTINALSGTGVVDATNGSTAGTRTISVQTGTFAGAVADSTSSRVMAVTKDGSGTLALTGASTYTGPTTINAGVLQLGAGSTTGSISGSSAITIASGATLASNRSNSPTISNNITGSGTIANNGTGELSLSGSNTFNGTIIANAKTNITGTYAAIGVPNVVTNSTFSLGLPFVDGTCTINALSGTGVVDATNGSTAGTRTISIQTGTFAGAVADSTSSRVMAVTKDGSGTLALTGASTYTGPTTINAGVLQLGAGSTTGSISGSSAITIASGATLASNRSNSPTISNNITGSGTIANNGTGELSLSGSNTFNGTIIANAKTNITGTYAAIGVPNVVTNSTFSLGLPFVGGTCTINALSGTGVVDATNGATVGTRTISIQTGTFAGAVADSTSSRVVAVTKDGSGTLALTGASTYTGPTTINAGVLQLGAGSTAGSISGSSAITIASGATLASNRSDSLTVSNNITGSGTIANNGIGELLLSGSNTFNGTILANTKTDITGAYATIGVPNVVANSQFSIGASFIGGTCTINSLTGSGTVDTAYGSGVGTRTISVQTGTFAGAFKDASSGSRTLAVTKDGLGTLTLTGSSSYTGPTTVSAGVLRLAGGNNPIKAGNAAVVNAVLDLNGRSQTLGSLTGSGTVTFGGGSLTVGSGDVDANFSGVLSGAGAFTKTGAGKTTLSGANTFTGNTTVSAGILAVNGSLASGTVAVSSSAELGGSGVLGSAVLSGAGLVGPGNSPGILTAGSIDPSSGLSFAFEFSGTGAPNYSSATNSINDVLRLTAATPFSVALTGSNVVDIYFSGSIAQGDTFSGGFYADLGGDFFTSLTNATFQYWVSGTGGGTDKTYHGQGYFSLTNYDPSFTITRTVVSQSADFGTGTVNGAVTQFVVVPEPSSFMLAGCGIVGLVMVFRRRNRTSE